MNYEVTEVSGGVPVKSWTRGVQLEDEARKQLERLAKMPFVHKWIAAMPDVHWGMGATVGSVVAMSGAIIPAAVGVDIGCGMAAVRTNLRASDLPDSLAAMRSCIEAAVPHGRSDQGGDNDRGAWGNPTPAMLGAWGLIQEGYDAIGARHPGAASKRPINQLCSLGTGNHFIEVCLDEAQAVWVMLHSGSRGAGNRIGSYFITKAKEEMRRWFINLPDQDLAYLPEGSELFWHYIRAVDWAQNYALVNRQLMMDATLTAISQSLGRDVGRSDEAVQCHHNYVNQEHHYGKSVLVTRKGAVSARMGELGIIPGSMGTKSFIVRGKGNPESFTSCSHGAGRAMSRTEAKKRFSLEDHARDTAGVECRKDVDVLDETPLAYKPIADVMAAQAGLVDIVHELKQVLCVKG